MNSGAPAARLLQVQRHDGGAAQAGFMARQKQAARAQQQPAQHGGEERVEVVHMHHMREQLGEQ